MAEITAALSSSSFSSPATIKDQLPRTAEVEVKRLLVDPTVVVGGPSLVVFEAGLVLLVSNELLAGMLVERPVVTVSQALQPLHLCQVHFSAQPGSLTEHQSSQRLSLVVLTLVLDVTSAKLMVVDTMVPSVSVTEVVVLVVGVVGMVGTVDVVVAVGGTVDVMGAVGVVDVGGVVVVAIR